MGGARAAGPGAGHLRLRHRPLRSARHPDRPAQEPRLHGADRRRDGDLRRRHRARRHADARHRARRLALVPAALRARHRALLRAAPAAHPAAGRPRPVRASARTCRRRCASSARRWARSSTSQAVVRDLVERLPQIARPALRRRSTCVRDGPLDALRGPGRAAGGAAAGAGAQTPWRAPAEPRPLADLGGSPPTPRRRSSSVGVSRPHGGRAGRRPGFAAPPGRSRAALRAGRAARRSTRRSSTCSRSLFGQAALALETSRLVDERTRQAELERELEIASSVQDQLLPRALARPRLVGGGGLPPARHVGGDFFTELPGPARRAIARSSSATSPASRSPARW